MTIYDFCTFMTGCNDTTRQSQPYEQLQTALWKLNMVHRAAVNDLMTNLGNGGKPPTVVGFTVKKSKHRKDLAKIHQKAVNDWKAIKKEDDDHQAQTSQGSSESSEISQAKLAKTPSEEPSQPFYISCVTHRKSIVLRPQAYAWSCMFHGHLTKSYDSMD